MLSTLRGSDSTDPPLDPLDGQGGSRKSLNQLTASACLQFEAETGDCRPFSRGRHQGRQRGRHEEEEIWTIQLVRHHMANHETMN